MFFSNVRKTKRIAKFDGLEPRRCEDIRQIMAPEIGPKSFGTFEKQAPGLKAPSVTGNVFSSLSVGLLPNSVSTLLTHCLQKRLQCCGWFGFSDRTRTARVSFYFNLHSDKKQDENQNSKVKNKK